ncbi:Leucine rich repeat N-terminal domain [Seminavis robusta]|uniref:Leucine rich repeat N-terminal domain n=1 Tax=Seminavis robusta TaxID=568900 RepID=A0A9N8DCS6_9STRA|nr:Leucine rich repeat N-terminal domain [Seminavis robusta]|eukprot:Sro60_g034630.1 Leucine rich repeat N-terminal domain (729) ;mRNA; f:51483-53754
MEVHGSKLTAGSQQALEFLPVVASASRSASGGLLSFSVQDHYQEVIDDLKRRGLHGFAQQLFNLQRDCHDQLHVPVHWATETADVHHIQGGCTVTGSPHHPSLNHTTIHPPEDHEDPTVAAMPALPDDDHDQHQLKAPPDRKEPRYTATAFDCTHQSEGGTAGESSANGAPSLSHPNQDYESGIPGPPSFYRDSVTRSQPSAPGAHNVVSSHVQHDQDQEEASTVTRSRDQDNESVGPRPPVVDDEENALEAVRVDDIPIVPAEPLQDKQPPPFSQKLLLLAGVIILCAVVIVGFVVGFSTRKQTTASPPESTVVTPSPTFAPMDRLVLMRAFYIDTFAPLYDDEGPTPGREHVEMLFQDSESPHYAALEWIALNDTPVETTISLDFLDDNATMRDDLRSQRLVQRYVLALLYFTTDGPTGWKESNEFLSQDHECDWSGALSCTGTEETNRTGHVVTTIDLRANGLSGPLIPELAALADLQFLHLEGNDITGSLPASLSSLTNLREFEVANNKLEGTVPEAYFNGWTNLESLKIGDNGGITGTLPSEIGNLIHLKALGAERLSWQGTVPIELYQRLTGLEFLEMSNMAYGFVNDTLPTEIGLWTNIKSFIMHGAQLAGTLPSEIGLATQLKRLQLSSSQIHGRLPSELGLLTAMTRLALSVNPLTGAVPKSFTNFEVISRLELQNTLLTGDIGFLCDAIEAGNMSRIGNLRVDMMEVSGCYCCTCCEY